MAVIFEPGDLSDTDLDGLTAPQLAAIIGRMGQVSDEQVDAHIVALMGVEKEAIDAKTRARFFVFLGKAALGLLGVTIPGGAA